MELYNAMNHFECIDKDILRDILEKNLAEVIDMFLTMFDKKMYEEALQEEGRDEMAEECQQLTSENQEMSKTIEEIIRAVEFFAFKHGSLGECKFYMLREQKDNGMYTSEDVTEQLGVIYDMLAEPFNKMY